MSQTQTTTDPEMLFASLLRGAPNPYEGYRVLRETAPVLPTSRGDLVLTRYADCDGALRERRLGKGTPDPRPNVEPSPQRQADAEQWFAHNILFSDPPEHTRLRRPVRAAFTAGLVEGLKARIEARVTALFDSFARDGGGDFAESVALALPLAVIQDLLGVPEGDRDHVTPLARELAALLRPFADGPTLDRASQARRELVGYFRPLLAERHETPADDLLSRMGADRSAGLDVDETIAGAVLLFAAGFETTSSLLSTGLLELLRNPAQFELLRAEPDLMPRAVEEMLRFHPPAQLNRRAVLAPVEIAGVELDTSRHVVTVIAAANRDPERFSDPERFDITRNEGPNLSFSAGTHFCLGAPLARMQAEVVFTRLLETFDRVEQAGPEEYRPGPDLYGLTHLPITVHAAGAGA